MHIQVIVTRTDEGATTQVRMDNREMRKDYASWGDALDEAKEIELINGVEAVAAKALPAGFPLHTSADLQSVDFTSYGFTRSEELPPPQ